MTDQDAVDLLRGAVGSLLWVLNNRHNAGTPLFEQFAEAAEQDARWALAAIERETAS